MLKRIQRKAVDIEFDMTVRRYKDDTILIRFWKKKTILQETGPLAVCEGSARLKKTPSFSFDLKIVGTTI